MMLFDETTKSVFPSDLFIQPGDQPAVVTEHLGSIMCGFYRDMGIFAHEDPVCDMVARIDGGPHRAAAPGLDPRYARRERRARDDPRLHTGAARGAVRLPGQGARARARRRR